jgi:hypothetical protein
MVNANIQVINAYRNYFIRNKNHGLLLAILRENRERTILLNTYHNIIEIHYYTGQMGCDHKGNMWEKTDIDWFGASYEILDALFDKYKDDQVILVKLAKFCMRSKSKSYWIKLKTTPLANEIMALILGAADEI